MKWYIIFCFVALPINASPCVKSSSCQGTLTFSDGGKINYYRTHPLGTKNKTIETAIVLIHGSERNANTYFDYLVLASGSMSKIFLMAPLFGQEAKTSFHYWPTSSWRKGDESARKPSISSYQVMDEIVEKIISSYGAVKLILIAGHSAGGQYVNRYVSGALDPSRDVSIRYVVMNPSTYLYVDKRRPGSIENCPWFNNYHYGLDSRNEYMSGKDIVGNFKRRNVLMMVGALDTSVDDNLDVSCAANAQGKHRLDRARNYKAYIETFQDWDKMTTYVEVPNSGHSAKKMIFALIKKLGSIDHFYLQR